MRPALDGDWATTVTGDPLRIAPRFGFPGESAESAPAGDCARFLPAPPVHPVGLHADGDIVVR
ncbi:hypothetical protein AB0D14_39825 [Streptomyces sp. NPDC048484]|uniref:hypothetical protein n=1 Tax=Streptomyces sp. NPDC048484 TaxID=3155146 RepID=UPI00341D5FDE